MRKKHSWLDSFLCTNNRLVALNLYTIIKRSLNQATNLLNLAKGDRASNADIVIQPDLYRVSRFEVKQMDKIILAGRRAAQANIKRIKKNLHS